MVMKDRIDAMGQLFRFITPILIAILGWVMITYLSNISQKFDSIDLKFDNFMSIYHNVDKRVDKLEYKVFGYNDEGNKGNIK